MVDHELQDLTPIERLAPQLEHLTLRTPSTQPLDLSRFPRLTSYRGPWAHVRDSVVWGTRIEGLMLDGYDASDLTVLHELPSLTALRLDRAEGATNVTLKLRRTRPAAKRRGNHTTRPSRSAADGAREERPSGGRRR